MGCVYNEITLPGKLSVKEVKEKVQEYIQDCQYESGHGGYSGTFAEARGVFNSGKTVENREDARRYLDGYQYAAGEWVDGRAAKWGPAVIVRVEPDDNKACWVVGANCSE
jgi:hypothetical protein